MKQSSSKSVEPDNGHDQAPNHTVLGENELKVHKFFIWNRAFARNKWVVIIAPVLTISAISIAYFAFAASSLVGMSEAEDMSPDIVKNVQIVNDNAASGKRAALLTAYGTTLSGSIVTSTSSNSITVVARSVKCFYWPVMSIVIDNKINIRGVVVGSSVWKSYSANVSLPAGVHSIKLINTGGCRNLYIDNIGFYGSVPSTPVPTVSLSANPNPIPSGTSTTLSWTSANTNSCTASGSWSGAKSLAGTYTTPALSTLSSFTITCSGSGGSASASTNVTFQSSLPELPTTSISCTKYASPNGSDTNSGTLTSNYLTVQKLSDSLTAGQTGCLRGGSYKNSSYVLNAAVGGNSSSPIIITSYPGERAKLLGTVQFKNTANYLVLSNVDIVGDGSQNTVQIYGSNQSVENSDITNNHLGLSCVFLGSLGSYGYDSRAVKTSLKNNRIHDCGLPSRGALDHCIYNAHTNNVIIQNNVFYNCQAFAIQFYPDAQGGTFDHNTIDGGNGTVRGGAIIGSEGNESSKNNTITNNIFSYSQSSPEIYSLWGGSAGTGNTASNNCTWAPEGSDTDSSAGGLVIVGNLHADPLFTDRASHNYKVAANSPCSGKGATF